MTPQRPRRIERKWLAVGAVWAVQSIAMFLGPGLLMNEHLPPDLSYLQDTEYIVSAGVSVLVMAALQAVFLWPVRKPGKRVGAGISVWLGIGVAALAAAVLVGAALATVVDAVWLAADKDPTDAVIWTIGCSMLVSWAVFTPLLHGFSLGRRRESALGRLSAALFLGTIVETCAIIPLDVMVRRKTNCYCAQGTFWALVATSSVGLFALGPAILLVLLARRRKRWYAGQCDACGYDMSGTPAAERCPECGAGWRAPTPES